MSRSALFSLYDVIFPCFPFYIYLPPLSFQENTKYFDVFEWSVAEYYKTSLFLSIHSPSLPHNERTVFPLSNQPSIRQFPPLFLFFLCRVVRLNPLFASLFLLSSSFSHVLILTISPPLPSPSSTFSFHSLSSFLPHSLHLQMFFLPLITFFSSLPLSIISAMTIHPIALYFFEVRLRTKQWPQYM